jgi:methylmalonyl-CoA carboxyltransferase large subunit
MVKVDQILETLQAKVAALEARLQELERPAPAPQPLPVAVAAAATPQREEISEEIMLLIAAAVAAYLGERAHIRVVRLLQSNAWAQQGRVSIQASHRLV